jgi:PAS domain S-box-containing protein
MFRLLFERSAEAILLFDPEAGVFVDCNAAAVELMRATSKEQLLRTSPADLAPPRQWDGVSSLEKAATITAAVNRQGSLRFEWVARRLDGVEVPLECLATAIPVGDRVLHVVLPRDISERKRTEAEVQELNATLEHRIAARTAELAASEARLRTLVEHAPEAIVVFDGPTGRFLSGNAHACRLYGRNAEELTQLSPTDVSPEFQPDGRRSIDVAREKMDEALAGGTPVFDWIHRDTEGRLIPTEVRLVRLPAEGRGLLRASIIDNTERRRREAIRQATFQISEAVYTADDLPTFYSRVHAIVGTLMPAKDFYIALYDETTELISFPYFVGESEPAPSPLRLGTGLTSYVVRTGKPLLVGKEMNARKRSVGTEVEFDGFPDLRYVESGVPAAIWLGVPLSLGGRAFGVMAVQDYHNPRAYGEEEKQMLLFVAGQTALAIERKRAQQDLLESERKFRALFEASSAGVMLHDDTQYLDVNPAAVRMFGYAAVGDLLGKNPVLTSPPVQPDGEPTEQAARRRIKECMQRGNARFDWLARRANGEDLPLEVILTRVEVAGRKIIQAVVHDISERKKTEMELLKTLAREKELHELKSSFVAMVSHEFRTPLGIIMSSAEILENYFAKLTPEDRRDHLTSIRKNTRRMADLMEEVLVLSRFEAGKMVFAPAPLNVSAFCRGVVDELASVSARRGPIEVIIPDSLPAAQGDEKLLRHILTNLLANAVKYSPPDAPVQLRLEQDGQEAVLWIEDHGIGIHEEDQRWLFRPFQRGRNVGQRSGSGLGLVIVQRCVALHNGTIQVHSAPEKGTTVTVRLPLFPLRKDTQSDLDRARCKS